MTARTQQLLLTIVNYDPGLCLCGHFERCEVCSRSQETRDKERRNKREALAALREAGIRLRRIRPRFMYDKEVYQIIGKREFCK
jgi:hypothetical protein